MVLVLENDEVVAVADAAYVDVAVALVDTGFGNMVPVGNENIADDEIG